ncbi:DUF2306 domain-containing protein [Bacillus sp. B-jedd]|uniref:DUF2306 domain-containing protein n=1 Tax=Bacillus sp. B-jedd TaxID=1476857 RepID=UPI0005155DA3|nr:DUF2306 domain-containing protein [Bacillus sp. B-jedd]CEG25461.1 membrane protein [Bacillus sp. B-jedd]
MFSSLIKKIGTGTLMVFVVLLAVSAIVRYFFLDPAITNKTLIEQGMHLYDFHYKPWNAVLLAHIITASIAIVIGPFQFSKKSRQKKLHLHRNIGKIYVGLIMISGITGIYLSYYAFGGIISKLGFLALSIAWLLTTYLAYKYIRKKNILQHERWMIRSYAVTLVAITFRIWSAVIGYSLDNFQLGYTAAIWVSLIGNLAAAEYLLRKKTASHKKTPHLAAI